MSTGHDDRLSFALLLAPFLIVALSLGAERAAHQLIASAPQLFAASRPWRAPAVPPPITSPAPAALQKAVPQGIVATPVPAHKKSPPQALPPPVLPSLALLLEPPPPVLPSLALLREPRPPVLPSLALLLEPRPPVLPSLALLLEPRPPVLPSLALLLEPPPPALPSLALLGLPPRPRVCTAGAGLLRQSAAPKSLAPSLAPAFGRALSDAARAQLGQVVIYNPKYFAISYPMGDVPAMFGVCTDVVVRAYRALGIDLQALVHQARAGSGDRNIDHRRVEVIRRYLTRQGAALPVTEFAEDYQPGDIVTYYRPQNRASTAHIAIVTDQIAPSGRPMIVHNRGWGPQLEDALFVDKITGHYRFRGPATASVPNPPAVHRRPTREAFNARARRALPSQQ
ncbi:MAG: DUF1287 domain-containing protein [Hyphomicrobiaceae bacterium]